VLAPISGLSIGWVSLLVDRQSQEKNPLPTEPTHPTDFADQTIQTMGRFEKN